MNYSIPAIIRGLVAPGHRLSCSTRLWADGIRELNRRGKGRRESGAFLLGTISGNRRSIKRFIFFDDLEPHCLDTGIIVFKGTGYGSLWQLCRESGLSAVADVHTHPGMARQSGLDRTNPMIAKQGHIAIIIPDFAQKMVSPGELGIYEYMGSHRWHDSSGKTAHKYFYVGLWG